MDSGTKEKEAYYKEIDYDDSNMFKDLLGSKGLKLVTVASGERIIANKTPMDVPEMHTPGESRLN